MTAGDHIDYRRFVPAEADLLAEFLTAEDWPYHGAGAPGAAQIREHAAAGDYDNDQTRTFWIVTGTGTEVGLIRLLDLADDTPLFDLRIRAAYRGAGLGTQALRWLTGYLFTEPLLPVNEADVSSRAPRPAIAQPARSRGCADVRDCQTLVLASNTCSICVSRALPPATPALTPMP